jgi:hypothetical protein
MNNLRMMLEGCLIDCMNDILFMSEGMLTLLLMG